MRKINIIRFTVLVLAIASAAFSWSTAAWAHGEATRIVPVSLSVKAGSKLEVTVNGLIGTDTATYKLTGISGKYDLGQFPISTDDFTQVLEIPADAPPGSYRLTVEGGGKSAKVVITIN